MLANVEQLFTTNTTCLHHDIIIFLQVSSHLLISLFFFSLHCWISQETFNKIKLNKNCQSFSFGLVSVVVSEAKIATVCTYSWYFCYYSWTAIWLMSHRWSADGNISSWRHIRKMSSITQQIIARIRHTNNICLMAAAFSLMILYNAYLSVWSGN